MSRPYIYGGDFEFCVVNTRTNNLAERLVFAEDIFGIDLTGQIGSDRIVGEIRPQPSDSPDLFVSGIYTLLNTARRQIKNHNPDYDICLTPAHFIEPCFVQEKIGLIPKAQKLSNWENYFKEKMESDFPENDYIRTAINRINTNSITNGAHFYFPYSSNTHIENTIKFFDIFIATASVIVFPFYGEKIRKLKYGKAGDYRINQRKNIFEYRTLSSNWLIESFMLQAVLNKMSRFQSLSAYSNMSEWFEKLFDQTGYTLQLLHEFINTYDVCEVSKFFNELKKYESCPYLTTTLGQWFFEVGYFQNYIQKHTIDWKHQLKL